MPAGGGRGSARTINEARDGTAEGGRREGGGRRADDGRGCIPGDGRRKRCDGWEARRGGFLDAGAPPKGRRVRVRRIPSCENMSYLVLDLGPSREERVLPVACRVEPGMFEVRSRESNVGNDDLSLSGPRHDR